MTTSYIGLKLGSTTTTILKAGNGIVLREPSLIAMPTNLKSKEVKAIGDEAKKLKGRLPQNISIFSPIANDIIQYEDLAIFMLKGFLKKIFPNKKLGHNIKAVVTTPLSITPQEQKTLESVCFKSGIADVQLIPDVLSYAFGAGIDISSESSNIIVCIGGDSTNIAIVSNYTIINGYNLSIGSFVISIAIAKYIEETYDIFISAEQADQLKQDICSLFESYSANYKIVGLNKKTQIKEEIIINSSELYPIVKHYYQKIAEAINVIIQSSDPTIISDITKNGIYFYGNGSNIIGLDKFMQSVTSMTINPIDSNKSNVLGTEVLINYPSLIKKIIKNN